MTPSCTGNRDRPSLLSLPPDILHHIFYELALESLLRTLAAIRQTCKRLYILATPALFSRFAVDLRQHTGGLYHGHGPPDTAYRTDWNCCSSSSTSPNDQEEALFNVERYCHRRKNDLSFVRTLAISNLPGPQSSMCRTPMHELPRLSTLLLTPPALQSLRGYFDPARKVRLHSYWNMTNGVPPSTRTTHSIMPRVLNDFSPKRLVVQYPSTLIDSEEADLAPSPLAHFLVDLIDSFPTLDETTYENVHLQPIVLCPVWGKARVKKQTIVFSRHAKCPDMGGVVRGLRVNQIAAALRGVSMRESCQMGPSLDYRGGTRALQPEYVFVNPVSTIPTWDGRAVMQEDIDRMASEIISRLSDGQEGEGDGFVADIPQFWLVEDDEGAAI
nr:uncharacterized protein CI109_005282 [Kwoniella shandongensis]KAA5526326.1 hypothetical protein CI109_005282 [Kwoniella shandongensis]